MKIFNILVFPGGTEIGLEIWRSLKDCKDIRLCSGGSPVSNHAPYTFARHFQLPPVHESNWLEALNRIIDEQQINYVIPAHDDVVVSLAENRANIKSGIVSSPVETCQIARSKRETYKVLSGVVPLPVVYESQAAIEHYPVFVKPDRGEGSRDVHVAKGRGEVECLLKQGREYIVTEFLPGEEFTIDCFSDREKGLLFCKGRQRVRTRSGISMSSRTVYEEIFKDFAIAISEKIIFHGAWFFQMKRDCAGEFKLLEVAPRIAGTMALNRVIGVNFALLSIYEQERIPISILTNEGEIVIDRALCNRFRHNLIYSAVYFDLDDTLILNGTLNLDTVKFLYQCINMGVKVTLLTKHDGPLEDTLRKFRLSQAFDEVIHIKSTGCKADYIKEPDAIFIDDSFSERKAVHDRHGIATFDSSMIEMLMDDRA
jgi:carbamoyl-phosphate synthase large subunit